jgi:hypothetical protein
MKRDLQLRQKLNYTRNIILAIRVFIEISALGMPARPELQENEPGRMKIFFGI